MYYCIIFPLRITAESSNIDISTRNKQTAAQIVESEFTSVGSHQDCLFAMFS